MGHADDEGASIFLDGRVDQELESRNERFAALETETFHSVELAGHERTPLMGII